MSASKKASDLHFSLSVRMRPIDLNPLNTRHFKTPPVSSPTATHGGITIHESRLLCDIDKRSTNAQNDKQCHHLSPTMPQGSGIRDVACATIVHLWASNAELLSRVGLDSTPRSHLWERPKWSASSPTNNELRIGDVSVHSRPHSNSIECNSR